MMDDPRYRYFDDPECRLAVLREKALGINFKVTGSVLILDISVLFSPDIV